MIRAPRPQEIALLPQIESAADRRYVRAGLRRVLCLAPEKRKAVPVRNMVQGPVATSCPASILRTAPHATLLIDTDSASLL